MTIGEFAFIYITRDADAYPVTTESGLDRGHGHGVIVSGPRSTWGSARDLDGGQLGRHRGGTRRRNSSSSAVVSRR